MKTHVAALLLCIAFSASAHAQNAPSEVTDKEIERYKAAAKDACMAPGLAKGDPRERVDALCSCIIAGLTKSMSRSEWQQAYFHSLRKQPDDERKVIAPHLPKPEVCRPPN
jgi:hypothetical protein